MRMPPLLSLFVQHKEKQGHPHHKMGGSKTRRPIPLEKGIVRGGAEERCGGAGSKEPPAPLQLIQIGR